MKHHAALIFSLASLPAIGGCSNLLGIKEAHVEDGSGGAGGSKASSLADGGADAADTGATPSAMGDGAAAVDASMVCGQGLSGSAGLDRVIRACVADVSCDPFIPFTISKCVTLNFLGASGATACRSTIRDCNGFYGCTGFRITTSAECAPGAASARCDVASNVAIDCDSQTFRNCSKLGGTCGTYTDTGGFRRANCVVAPSCLETDGAFHCSSDGRFLYTCQNGVAFGEDCTLEDSTCGAAGKDMTCIHNGANCSAAPGFSCKGAAILSECIAGAAQNNRQFDYDCAALGFSCDSTDATCLAPGCTFPGTCPAVESCGKDGKTLTVCAGGAPLAIDCVQQGFSGCGIFTDATGEILGYCKP